MILLYQIDPNESGKEDKIKMFPDQSRTNCKITDIAFYDDFLIKASEVRFLKFLNMHIASMKDYNCLR